MVKKRVLCSSALLMLMLMSNLYSKPQPEMSDPFRKALDHSMKANISETLAKKEAENDPYSQLSFAETDIPLEEVSVQKKLDKYLSRFAYLKKPSHHIHKKADQLLPRRSEEHTSELQSRENLVCRLL